MQRFESARRLQFVNTPIYDRGISHGVTLSKDVSDRITIFLPYKPQLAIKVKSLIASNGIPVLVNLNLAPVIASVAKQSQKFNNFPLVKGGEGGFEKLRRELVSRKHSYNKDKRTVYLSSQI